MTDKLLSTTEAAKRWGISTTSARRLVKSHRVRGTRILRRVLIAESEVARVIREGAGDPWACRRPNQKSRRKTFVR
jgi:excisionase family DNA binding protein